MQSEIVQILSGTGYHLMVMAAGVFAITGSLLTASGKTYRKIWVLFLALLLFAVSAMTGYLFEGFLVSALVSALDAGKFNPFDKLLVGSGLTQLVLFLAGSGLLIWFYADNMLGSLKQSDEPKKGKQSDEDN